MRSPIEVRRVLDHDYGELDISCDYDSHDPTVYVRSSVRDSNGTSRSICLDFSIEDIPALIIAIGYFGGFEEGLRAFFDR